jgi:hypothetical protein
LESRATLTPRARYLPAAGMPVNASFEDFVSISSI